MYQGQPLALLHCTVITVNSTHILLLVQHIRTYYLCINFGMGVFIHSYYQLPLLLSRKSTIHATISLNHSLSHLYMENFQPTSAKKISPHMWLQIFDQIFVNCISSKSKLKVYQKNLTPLNKQYFVCLIKKNIPAKYLARKRKKYFFRKQGL